MSKTLIRFRKGERVTIEPDPELGGWRVLRGRGRAHEVAEEAITDLIAYSPGVDRWIPRAELVETGATVVVVQPR